MGRADSVQTVAVDVAVGGGVGVAAVRSAQGPSEKDWPTAAVATATRNAAARVEAAAADSKADVAGAVGTKRANVVVAIKGAAGSADVRRAEPPLISRCSLARGKGQSEARWVHHRPSTTAMNGARHSGRECYSFSQISASSWMFND